MTTPEEIAARRDAYEDDEDNRRPDYPAAVRTIVTAVRDLVTTERRVVELEAECADRESERADLRDRLTKAEAKVARVEALAKAWETERYPGTGDAGWNNGYDMRRETDVDGLRAALEGGDDE